MGTKVALIASISWLLAIHAESTKRYTTTVLTATVQEKNAR
jgi:hypothetical protein